jgi:hypothetical protein
VNSLDWLLDSDPSIRWQVMRNLLAVFARERSRLAFGGLGAMIVLIFLFIGISIFEPVLPTATRRHEIDRDGCG